MERRLGPYALERRIGAGGFGAVWIGVHEQSRARHALKVIELATPEEAQRFQREAEALARLDGHPHAVRLHSAFSVGATAVLATELVEGQGDLGAYLAQHGAMPPRQAVRVVWQVAQAVAHAHARGIVHRDLKPANVLLDRDGGPRLIDLGLASVSGGRSLTRTGEVMGTPGYMAPEQARGERGDARTDVFGLGALLFTCLTGRPPRESGPAMAVLVRAASQPLPPVESLRPEVPRPLCELVRRATALDPADRHAGAAELADALAAALTGNARRRGARWSLALGTTGLALIAALLLGPRTEREVAPVASAPAVISPEIARLLRDVESSPPDAAALCSVAVSLRARLLGTGAPVPPGLAAAVLDAQSRLVDWTLDADTEEPDRLDREVAATVAALGSLAALAGLDGAALAQRRSARLDELASKCASDLRRAIHRDRQAHCDERVPAPATRLVLRRIRAALAAGREPPGPGLREGFEHVIRELSVSIVESTGWESGVQVLLALEAYRFYWFDARTSPAFQAWGSTKIGLPKHVLGWAQLALARLGIGSLEIQHLRDVDPQLHALARRPSRLLLAGELTRRGEGPLDGLDGLAIASELRGLVERAPWLLDELAEPTEHLIRSDLQLCAYALDCARRIVRRLEGAGREGEARALLETALVQARSCAPRFEGVVPFELDLLQVELDLERELVRRTRSPELADSLCRRRRASREGGAKKASGRARIELDLIEDLRLTAELDPSRARARIEEALGLARHLRDASPHAGDSDRYQKRAGISVARLLIALGAPADPPPAEVEAMVDLSHSINDMDNASRGMYGLLQVEAALAKGDPQLAAQRLEDARARARIHPDWAIEPDLEALARRVTPR